MPVSLKTLHLRSLQPNEAFQLGNLNPQLCDIITLLADFLTGFKARLFHHFTLTFKSRVRFNQRCVWVRVKSSAFGLDGECFERPFDA